MTRFVEFSSIQDHRIKSNLLNLHKAKIQDNTMLLLTSYEVHMAKYSDSSFKVRSDYFFVWNEQLVNKNFIVQSQ